MAVFFMTSCGDDENYSISSDAVVKGISTGDAAVTAISATTYGTVSGLSVMSADRYQVGTVYGINADPTVAGTKQIGSIDENGNVTANISGLNEGTTYYYATYVTLQGKVTKYGEVKTFVATDADVATAAATDVTSCHATFNGQANGVSDILADVEAGFRYSITEAGVQTGVDVPLENAAATISTTAAGLLPATTYYYAAYNKIGDGYIYGNVQSFTTAPQAMEYVDLGLSVLWAKCNIGAEAENEQGILVGFGDQTFYNHSVDPNVYTPWDIAGTEEDVIYNLSIDGDAQMKSTMPTVEQIKELIANTTQTQETVDGVQGMRFTAINGNSIFLPFTGYRNGEETVTDGDGYYWTGNVSEINEVYAKTLKIGSTGNAKTDISSRHLGLAIRSVRMAEPVAELEVDNSKLAVGDIEDNGRIRMEIYNMYGSTASNPSVNPQQIKFSKNMIVTFKLSGINDNLKEGAAGTYYGGLEYADESWDPSLWSSFNSKYDCAVTGDGTYTVWMETGGATAEGAAVFCVDINGLGADLVDISKVKAEIVSIKFDVEDSNMQYYVDNTKVIFNNKDGNGTDGRIEIFNEYGDTKGMGVDVSDLAFSGYMIINFTIEGINGNLVDGADDKYKTELSFADASWDPSYWGGVDFAATSVTGDGSYTVFAPLNGNDCEGAVVWAIELYGLWKDLVDPTKVKAKIDSIIIPGKK